MAVKPLQNVVNLMGLGAVPGGGGRLLREGQSLQSAAHVPRGPELEANLSPDPQVAAATVP